MKTRALTDADLDEMLAQTDQMIRRYRSGADLRALARIRMLGSGAANAMLWHVLGWHLVGALAVLAGLLLAIDTLADERPDL